MYLDYLRRLFRLFWREGQASSIMLKELIRGVEESSGNARSDARAEAKAWLLSHVATLSPRDILLARDHFSYLLPPGWGLLPDPSRGMG
jgi:hypothetical protein